MEENAMENIKLFGDFDPDMGNKVTTSLYRLLHSGCKRATILIDSNGGRADVLQNIVDAIMDVRSQGMKVDTFNVEKAYSCGAMLLSMGDKRFQAPHAKAMLHCVSTALPYGRIDQIRENLDELEKYNNMWMKWVAKNLKISYNRLRKETSDKDWFLSPQEALKIGLIDKIKPYP
jgi:ATP-dependent Clp protease protease subunit